MEMDLTMKYKGVMTEQEKQALEKARREWQELCAMTSKKEQEREDQYRKFF